MDEIMVLEVGEQTVWKVRDFDREEETEKVEWWGYQLEMVNGKWPMKTVFASYEEAREYLDVAYAEGNDSVYATKPTIPQRLEIVEFRLVPVDKVTHEM